MLRFAPSPTGDMHIDSLRVAIINYIVSQQQHKPFLVRINDTDKKRVIEGKDTEIMQILEKFAIQRDLVYHQSEHLNIHQTLAIKLLKEGKAFICKCPHDELEAQRQHAEENGVAYRYSGICETLSDEEYQTLKKQGESFVIRLKKPSEGHDIDSIVIMQTDNTPTSHFASACDDMLSNIDTIIETEDQCSNRPIQTYIKKMLGYNEPTAYLYLPKITNNEAVSIKELFEQGFIPDAILNYLLLLGNDKIPKKIFTLPEAIEWFDLNAISKNTVPFNIKKLRLINREHLKMMDDKELSKLFGFADADIGRLAKVYLEEASTVNELEAKIRLIFTPKEFNGKWGEAMQTIEQLINDAPAFETLDELTDYLTQKSGLKEENLLPPLYILLTGTENGPELRKIYPHIKSYLLEVIS